MTEIVQCPSCKSSIAISKNPSGQRSRFCPYCGAHLFPGQETTIPLASKSEVEDWKSSEAITLIQEHLPEKEKIQFSIGPYQVLNSIGKGGMGEVFLAYDTTCGRTLALKRIRPDLIEHSQLHNRFLKEARVTSQLAHPSIIPIYAIHTENNLAYYTMPYVEGETLKDIFKRTRTQEKKGVPLDHVGGSIPALSRIFLSICQAVAYSHSKGVLHRDLKPENIIIGQYGQVIILDWGLAKLIKQETELEEISIENVKETEKNPLYHLTHIGKVVGTVAYMAPERALGQPANFQTDIYSLGVILYQILTLRSPFKRESLKEFRQNMQREKLPDPMQIAPYRDIPHTLAQVVQKCLSTALDQRYHTVDELIHDIENYIEGRSDWFKIAELDSNRKTDWEFQENVFIAEHVAITRGTEISDWVNLMISKGSFQENTKIEAKVKIGEKGHGIGFLLCIPEAAERQHLNDGYCLWLGTENNSSTKLLRSTVEVMHAPEIVLKNEEWYSIRIEKIDNNIHFYLNEALQFSYISHRPLVGTHVGLLSRDANFTLKDFLVYVRSQNITVNCLAVPDAFLAHKDYNTALSEYRRIGYSFPGRAEGREAMFRAGITLLEQANDALDQESKVELYDLAQDEFSKLHGTPGAPLEYLGKALVYQAQGDFDEEAKCFELAFRRYPKHPLLTVLQEQIIYRMHESSRMNRKATFNFMLLAASHLPNVMTGANTRRLFSSLQKHWEPLFFVQDIPGNGEQLKKFNFCVKVAFWLAKPYPLIEMIQEMIKLEEQPAQSLSDAIFCLIELGCWEHAKKLLKYVFPRLQDESALTFAKLYGILSSAILAHSRSPKTAVEAYLSLAQKSLGATAEYVLIHILELALDAKDTDTVFQLCQETSKWPLSEKARQQIQCCEIWAHLLEKNWSKAGEIFQTFSIEFLSQETSLLYFLYGCWLYRTEGRDIAMIHFSGVLDVPFPRTWMLASHFIKGKINESAGWIQKAFLWEKRQLFRQLALFNHCIGEQEKSIYYTGLAKQESIHDAE